MGVWNFRKNRSEPSKNTLSLHMFIKEFQKNIHAPYMRDFHLLNHLRSRVWIVMRPTENDSTKLYKNGDISVVITYS